MKQWFSFSLVSLFLIYSAPDFAAVPHAPGQVLVKIKPGWTIPEIEHHLNNSQGAPYFHTVTTISKQAGLYLLAFNNGPFSTDQILNQLRQNPFIDIAQLNHRIKLRRIPNDTRFKEQWSLLNTGQNMGNIGNDINIVSAWNYTTGGKTALGEDIVIAVLDDGIALTHPDLSANLWVNPHEIFANQIDDDHNGIIDDVYGINTENGTGLIADGDHGTEVAGLIGAVGDNQLGITGVNWHTKLMMIKNNLNDLTEAHILLGYDYVLQQRKRYNESDGKEGALIVVTNASFGIDQGKPEEAPLWCMMYDDLGQAGILSVGSTSNEQVNVDEVGDLPSTCPSNFFVSVTSSDHRDLLTSGFGFNHVDLAAPGVNILTLSGEDAYAQVEGTSFATALVSGAIALLHAAPSPHFAQKLKKDPLNTALALKTILLNNVTKVEAWAGLINSGGRLNLGSAMAELMTRYTTCPPPTKLSITNLSDRVNISWDNSSETEHADLRWRYPGQAWNVIENVTSPLALTTLSACSAVEIQIRSDCSDSEGEFSSTFVHQTLCCESPVAFTSIGATDSSLTIAWLPQDDAVIYRIEWRENSSQNFQSASSTNRQITLQGLDACTIYEVRVLTICTDSISVPGTTSLLQTLCPECDVKGYCKSLATDASYEWIDSIYLNQLGYKSGNNQGYADLTDSAQFVVMEHEKYSLKLIPGFADNVQSKVVWQVWIDYNFDHDFDDPGELIVESNSRSDSTFTGSFFVPTLNKLGKTIMRVSMKALVDNDDLPGSCDTIFAGEVEDYCLELSTSVKECAKINGYKDIATNAVGMQLQWDTVPNGIAYLIRYKRENEKEFNDWEITMSDTLHALTGLRSCTDYIVELQSICRFDTSVVHRQIIKTGGNNCTVGTDFLSGPVLDLKVYPNPFYTDLHLSLTSSKPSDLLAFMYNMQGQVIEAKDFGRVKQGENELFWDLPDDLGRGAYIIRFKTNEGYSSTKLIKN